MTFRRFEDIIAWQTARKVAGEIYDLSDSGPFRRDFALREQVRKAAISMMANIAEGFSRRSEREFAQYLFVAKASSAELQSHLYLALDRGYFKEEEFGWMYDRLDYFARQVSNLITYLRLGKTSGTKRLSQSLSRIQSDATGRNETQEDATRRKRTQQDAFEL